MWQLAEVLTSWCRASRPRAVRETGPGREAWWRVRSFRTGFLVSRKVEVAFLRIVRKVNRPFIASVPMYAPFLWMNEHFHLYHLI